MIELQREIYINSVSRSVCTYSVCHKTAFNYSALVKPQVMSRKDSGLHVWPLVSKDTYQDVWLWTLYQFSKMTPYPLWYIHEQVRHNNTLQHVTYSLAPAEQLVCFYFHYKYTSASIIWLYYIYLIQNVFTNSSC